MSDIANYMLIALFGAAVVAWAIMAFHNFRMIAHRRKGNWAFFIDPIWWLPSRAREHFTEEGMIHYRRTMKSMLGFFGVLVAIMIMMFIASYLTQNGY